MFTFAEGRKEDCLDLLDLLRVWTIFAFSSPYQYNKAQYRGVLNLTLKFSGSIPALTSLS